MVNRKECVLLIIDVQEKLIDTIDGAREILENIKALAKSAHALGIPILVTEQEKLGSTVPELNMMVPCEKTLKLTFSCSKVPEFMSKLQEPARRTVIVCGIEAHICVLQTVLDLLKNGYMIMVPKDATSSHATVDRDTALQRMRDSEAVITTTEALIYELTERAGTEEFRKILDIVKERRLKVAN